MAGLIDRIAAADLISMVFLALAWGLWCLGHSLLISQEFQHRFQKQLGHLFRFYRLGYNGFALVSVIPVLGYSHAVKKELLFTWQGVAMAVWVLLWLAVIYLGVQGGKAYDLGYFTGIRQAFDPESKRNGLSPLSRSGILSVIRHPWYLAALIVLWVRSRNIFVSTLVENLILTLYIFIGLRLEEKKLVRLYGNTYTAYQSKVPALLPWKKIFSSRAEKP